jgi:4-methyl-5(b-hydroxyethyl)-thiazole monophosphate biosynthesis
MKTVLLLLANGFEEYEASSFTDVLGWSRIFGIPVEAITAGMHPKLKCTWNFTVIPEKLLKEINIVDEYDALAVPGGFEKAGFYDDAYSKEFLEIIRKFYKKDKIIASICVGALPLGKSGILKGRSATTYPLPDNKRRKELAKFGVRVFNRDIVIDKNIITSAGPGKAVDVAFALLELLTSKNNCDKIKRLMGFKEFMEYKVFR